MMDSLKQRLMQNFIDGTLAGAVEIIADEQTDPIVLSCLHEAAGKLRWAAKQIANQEPQ